MTARHLPALFLIGATLPGCLTASGERRPGSADRPASAPDPQALVARLSPGPHHRHLDALAGRWESTVTVWPRPGADPNSSGGTSEVGWILDGRWLRLDYRAADAGKGGVQGLGLIGYDNVRQEHVFNWMDSVSCSALESSGRCADGGRTTEFAGTHGDPLTGERDLPFRWRCEIGRVGTVDAGTWSLELFEAAPGGEEFRKIRIVNTRAGATAAAAQRTGG